MNVQNNKLTINKINATENFERTKILLENYRMIVWTMSFFAKNIDVAIDKQSLRGKIKAYPESKSLLSYLDQILRDISRKPDHGEDMYAIINSYYMDEHKMTSTEICNDLFISESHYYRLKKEAISLISEKMWNSSNPDSAAWRKFVEALDDKRHRKEAS